MKVTFKKLSYHFAIYSLFRFRRDKRAAYESEWYFWVTDLKYSVLETCKKLDVDRLVIIFNGTYLERCEPGPSNIDCYL